MLNYIGNAKIVSLSDLPKIGDKIIYLSGEYICIELKINEITNDYIIYEVWFCENESFDLIEKEFYVDCCYWLYAVKKSELK